MTTSAHPSVTVLLSSFNGAAYIEQQVNSILDQRGVDVNLLIRDDGSTDQTVEILKKMAAENKNISLILGENIGVVQSFFSLLKTAVADKNATGSYYSLSDQDDFWLPDKLLMAVNVLEKQAADTIQMYCSAIEYVDETLHHLRDSQIYKKEKIGFKNALVQNIATGCTIVLNRAAATKVSAAIPKYCVMHDWWIYLVVSAFGCVLYDPHVSLKYRQHGRNVMGVASGVVDQFRRRLKRLANVAVVRTSVQLTEFDRLYADQLDARKRRQLASLLSGQKHLFGRIRLVLSPAFHRQNVLDDMLIRLTILIGKF